MAEWAYKCCTFCAYNQNRTCHYEPRPFKTAYPPHWCAKWVENSEASGGTVTEWRWPSEGPSSSVVLVHLVVDVRTP